MKKEIQPSQYVILQELYLQDPSLEQDEEKLAAVIEMLQQGAPESTLHPAFRKRLGNKIATRALEMKKLKAPFWQKVDFRLLFPFLGGAAFVAFAGFMFWPQLLLSPEQKAVITPLLSDTPITPSGEIKSTTPQDFGKIVEEPILSKKPSTKKLVSTTKTPVVSPTATALPPKTLSGTQQDDISSLIAKNAQKLAASQASGALLKEEKDNRLASTGALRAKSLQSEPTAGALEDRQLLNKSEPESAAVSKTTPTGENDMMMDSMPLNGGAALMGATQEQTGYRWVWNGATPLPQKDIPVLKRNAGFHTNNISSLLKKAAFDGLTVGSLTAPTIDTLTINEDIADGYTITLDIAAGELRATTNNDKWPELNCTAGQKCKAFEPYSSLTAISDLTAAIAPAKKLATHLHLPSNKYGLPIINPSWLANARGMNSVGPEVEVLFPLTLSGMEVYDAQGNREGVIVSVNMRLGKAVSLTGLEAGDYIASVYPLEQNISSIRQAVLNGGINAPKPTTGKNTTVPLSEPKLVYSHITKWIDGKNVNYYVPALVYPVAASAPLDTPANNVLVPLVQDFYSK